MCDFAGLDPSGRTCPRACAELQGRIGLQNDDSLASSHRFMASSFVGGMFDPLDGPDCTTFNSVPPGLKTACAVPWWQCLAAEAYGDSQSYKTATLSLDHNCVEPSTSVLKGF